MLRDPFTGHRRTGATADRSPMNDTVEDIALETSEIEQRRSLFPTAPPAAPAIVAPAKRWVRRGLFLLLPLALIIGSWTYVGGGLVMSTENSYVEADKVALSTD